MIMLNIELDPWVLIVWELNLVKLEPEYTTFPIKDELFSAIMGYR